jgi:hypothetical protein
MKDRKVKQVLCGGRGTSGRGRAYGRGDGG